MAVAQAPPAPPRPVPAAAWPAEPTCPAGAAVLRVLALVGVFALGASHWARQVAPTASGVAWQQTVVVAGLVAVLLALGRVAPGRARVALTALVALGSLGAVLIASGVPLRLLWVKEWGTLADGIGQGLSALPGLSVPYRGRDEWVRWTLASGAGVLGGVAALIAFAPRRRAARAGGLPVALVLGVLYGVAVVQRNPEHPFLSGAAFTLGLGVLLGAGRIAPGPSAAARAGAVVVAGLALGAGALGAPRLDGDRPLIDYRSFTDALVDGSQARFDWDHGYGPLDWARDGRELLRVKARTPSYWKASSLERFDGRGWSAQVPSDARALDTPLPAAKSVWFERARFTVRNLRSEQYFSPGVATAIDDVVVPASPAGSGTWRVGGRPLKQGDTFTADAYVPKPEAAELARAGTDYPEYALAALSIELPEAVGGPPGPTVGGGLTPASQIRFAAFGRPGDTRVAPPEGLPYVGGGTVLDASAYRRTWRLAQLLRAQAATPYELVRTVRRRVMADATYSELPEGSRIPLERFLFDDRTGYCQQFSGAMALLLRMGGVPARVASGFTPGTFDRDRGEYVVRDLDAHSWVEVFFPDIGWVTFDPTPTEAPPRAQDIADESGSGNSQPSGGADPGSLPDAGDVGRAADAGNGTAADPRDGGPPLRLVALGIVMIAALGLWVAALRRRRPDPLAELERALRRTGRTPAPGTTLRAIEEGLAGAPEAQAHVRRLRLARFAAGPIELPADGRRALRRELAAGLGPLGRLRARWALP